LPASPYLTGGSGVFATGGPEFNADQEVITNPAGTLLYAVNGHSNSIAAFTINADGTLTTVPGSPFASGGQDPVSIGLSGKFLVVANKNQDPNQNIGGDLPNYTTFQVSADGSLTMNAGSTLDLAAGSSPSQALVWSKGHIVFGMEFATSRIATYKFGPDGTMTELGSVSPTTRGGLFLGEILHPTRKVLYAGLLTTNQVGVYRFNAAGAISFVRTVPNGGSDLCWLRTNAAGTRLYTSESVSDTLSVYDLTDALNPVLLQQFALIGTNGPVTNISLDPTETFLYALAGTAIHVLNLDLGGMMSETISPVELPGLTTAVPLGLAVVRK
jgi:6-phosphogluconolactonase (cycloisomerase 2 family)